MITYGIIGTGNMGGAIALALSRSGGDRRLLLSNRTREKAAALAEKTGGEIADNIRCAAESDYLFLGVKPQMMEEVLSEISPILAGGREMGKRVILVSMAAGLSTDTIRSMAGGDYPIIRIMPNTPVSIGRGMTLYTEKGVNENELDEFLSAMKPSGQLERMPENLMDAGSALSGCSPAYVYMFIEALADGGVECGLPRDKAVRLAAQTVSGAAELVLESGLHPGQLKDAVCSPGGTTIAGVHALEKGSFRALGMDAVRAAFEMTSQLKHPDPTAK